MHPFRPAQTFACDQCNISFSRYIFFQIYLTAIKTSQPIRICAFVYMPRSAVITACLPNRKLHNALFTEREFCFFSKHHLMLNSETEYLFSLSAVLYALAWTWTCTCEKDRFFCAECLCWCEQAFTICISHKYFGLFSQTVIFKCISAKSEFCKVLGLH